MSLITDYQRFPGDQLQRSEIEVAIHPTQALVLLRIDGTAIMLGLDDDGCRGLVDQLLRASAALLARVPK